jgi:2'-aminobiphenyl-2,3-diol 1,2-dioxygenase large subunit
MQVLGNYTSSSKPDVILMFTIDHMFNIDLSLQPPFCLGVADSYMPLGDLDVPKRKFKGHRDFAMTLAKHSPDYGFDLCLAESLTPDHGVTIPLLFIKPWGHIPVVPLYVNINLQLIPTPKRCYELAQAIRDIILKHRPDKERVAIIGSGGLSHWLNIPGMGNVSEVFDEEIIDTVISGRGESISKMTVNEILDKGGNGGLEIMNWMMMTAMVPHNKGSKVYYEPMPEWMTGIGGVSMSV